jgi:hypothetical protein
MKQTKRLPIISFLLSLLMLFSPSCRPVQLKIELNREGGTVSIDAKEQLISKILQQLEEQEGIRVQVVNLEDKPVTVSLKNVPFDSMLRQILPPDARYTLNPGAKELSFKGNTSDKRPGNALVKKEGVPKSAVSDTSSVRPKSTAVGHVKADPEKIVAPDVKVVRGGKPQVEESMKTQGTQAGKTEKANIRGLSPHRYFRLQMRMEGDVIKIEKAQILAGDYVAIPSQNNDFVYALEMGGSVQQVGAFTDPLALHSYQPNPQDPHQNLRAKSGYFNLNFPERFADEKTIRSLILRIYRPQPGVTVPLQNIDQFLKSQRSLQPVTSINLGQEDFRIENRSNR